MHFHRQYFFVNKFFVSENRPALNFRSSDALIYYSYIDPNVTASISKDISATNRSVLQHFSIVKLLCSIIFLIFISIKIYLIF